MSFKLFENEDDYGPIEYKRHILLSTSYKIHHHISQIKYRMGEGNGTAYYLLGINDDGSIADITLDVLNLSLLNLKKLCYALNYEIKNILSTTFLNKRFYIVKIFSNLDIYSDLSYFIT